MPNVSYRRKELRAAERLYSVIRDCVGGEPVVKSRATKYLPEPNDGSDKKSAATRYAAYLMRAVFYGVTKRTIDGLIGQIFLREPVIELPDAMQLVIADGDGAGVSLAQMANSCSRHVLSYGRAGLLVDYPVVEGAVSAAQIAEGDIRPTMTLYEPNEILNWRTIARGAREILSLVVLEECYTQSDDGFEAIEKKQWRALRLINNIYTVEIYREENGAKPWSSVIPRDADGQPLDEIPFLFVGSENNDSTIDAPPMYDIASLNVAHYRNSADYEESVFMIGQPTPVFMGLTEDWVKNVLGGKVYLGARGAVSLPAGGDAKLLQAQPNSLALEAMQHKEKQMVALGARVVEKRAVVRTASEANIDSTNESSVLSSIAKNVSAAFTAGLKWMTRFTGEDDSKIKFELNTDFDIATMSPEERRQLIEEWQSGAISWEEVRINLRKSGIASMTDEEARKVIDEEQARISAKAVDDAAALADATAQPGGGNDNAE